MNHKKILTFILILAMIFRIISALIIPIFDKPDEQQHFDYIEFIQENKKLPIVTENQSGEFFQPPFYHAFASFILNIIKTFTHDIWYHIFYLRLLSITVSMFTLFFIYKIAALIFRDKILILSIVAFASLLPSYINMKSTVTNANLGDLLTTIIIYLILRNLITRENKQSILLTGLTAGISLITRMSAIPAILTIPFAFVVKHYPKIKRTIKPLTIILLLILIISGWNLFRNFILYDDPIGINALKLAHPPDDIQVTPTFIGRILGWTFITFWASFGRTNNIFIGNLTSTTGLIVFIVSYLLLLLFTLSAIYGLYRFIKKYRKNKNILSDMQKKSFMILIFHLIILSLSFISFNLYDFQPQGRLFFPAISTLSIFFTLGIYNLINTTKKYKFLYSYITLFLVLNIISIINIMQHYIK